MPDPVSSPSPDGTEKDASAVRIFPPGVALVTVPAGLVLAYIWPLVSDCFLGAPLRYGLGGAIVLAATCFPGFRAALMMRRSGQSENPYKKTTAIIEAGPYRLTRNPMYLQMVLVCIGLAVLLGNLWLLMLTPVCALVLHVLVTLPEETYLERKFGDEYLACKQRVRRWI